MWQRYRGLIAGAAALAVCLAVLAVLYGGGDEEEPREPRAGAPPGFLGVVAEDAFGRPGAYRSRTLDRVRAAGAGLVRQTFDWTLIERSPGRYDFSFYDRFVAALAKRGLQLLPILFNPPPIRSSAPPRGRRRGTYPPRRFADLGAFGAVLARRYGPGGSFWRSRPRLPRLPVRSWQIWNEPNVPVYWPPGPDAAAYARLLRVTGQAIKRVDPGAEIVTAGLAESELGVPLQSYLEGMYEAGAAGTFDVLALNPFAPDAQRRAGGRGCCAARERRSRRRYAGLDHGVRLGHRWPAQRLPRRRGRAGRSDRGNARGARQPPARAATARSDLLQLEGLAALPGRP